MLASSKKGGNYCDKSVSFRPARFRVHYQLDVVDLTERLEDSAQHVFGDVEVQGTNVQSHGARHAFGHEVGHRVAHPVLLCLRVLHNDGDSQQFLSRQTQRLKYKRYYLGSSVSIIVSSDAK